MKLYTNRLSELRKNKKETQDQLASLIGVERSTYSRYETGTSEMTLKTILTLSNHFDVSLDYLFFKSNIPNYNNFDLSNIEAKLLLNFKKFNSNEQENILKMIEMMKPNPNEIYNAQAL
jgi:transcriptional regulator with XRE-family HTH domain